MIGNTLKLLTPAAAAALAGMAGLAPRPAYALLGAGGPAAAAAPAGPAVAATHAGPASSEGGLCTAAGPDYYAFPLVTTRNVPGTGLATGTAEVSFPATSPFSISLASDGSYRYDVSVGLERAKAPARGTLVVWVSTPDLNEVERIGPLDEHLRARGQVAWNKFLVVITLEATDDPAAARWSGPVAFRGMSRSGMMHTMVGHGAFQQENCAAYGY
jgi:hypothetical protein